MKVALCVRLGSLVCFLIEKCSGAFLLCARLRSHPWPSDRIIDSTKTTTTTTTSNEINPHHWNLASELFALYIGRMGGFVGMDGWKEMEMQAARNCARHAGAELPSEGRKSESNT